MPMFDGLELTQMIRQPGANANPFVAIIMLTGHSEKKTRHRRARRRRHRISGQADFGQGLYQRIVNVVANPRPFIKTKTYFGPDRRRNDQRELFRPRTPQRAARPTSFASRRLLEKVRSPG